MNTPLFEVYTITPEVAPEVRKLLKGLKRDMSRTEIMAKLQLKDEKNFRVNYVHTSHF